MIPPHSRRWLRSGIIRGTALLMLTAGGFLLRLPEQRIRHHEQEVGLLLPPPPADSKDTLNRQLSFFALGGLRTLAAEILAMDATDAWLVQDWPRARKRWEQITTLCPNRPSYWSRAARDMAKNAVAHVNGLRDISEHERATLVREYLDAAEEFYRQGLAANPDSLLLQLDMAGFYEDLTRRPQFAKAVDAYRKALAMGASDMYLRWVFYNLCRIRGREREAWELGRELFRTSRHHTPSVRCLLFALQHKLNLPREQRYSIEELFHSDARARKQLRSYLHNTLRFPVNGVEEYLQSPTEGNSR
ncbi:MAG: hypothetical protein IJ498_02870 [Akkermansia sp.]|nr:hypothetical protein [Akkermansia sp.]